MQTQPAGHGRTALQSLLMVKYSLVSGYYVALELTVTLEEFNLPVHGLKKNNTSSGTGIFMGAPLELLEPFFI